MPHPPAPPVRIEPEMRAGIALQPPYPASERRMNREGTVTIRLLIGADGRVKSAEKVRATSEAFYSVTERHALSRWRFRRHPGRQAGREPPAPHRPFPAQTGRATCRERLCLFV